MKCVKCGTEVINSNICPNCGAILPVISQDGQGMRTLKMGDQAAVNNTQTADNNYTGINGNPAYGGNNPGMSSPVYKRVENKKNSGLGILSLILSCTIILSVFGLIIGVIDLCSKDGKKKTLSVVSICIAGFFLFIGIVAGLFSDNTKSGPDKVEIVADEDSSSGTEGFNEGVYEDDLSDTEISSKKNDTSGEAVYEISDTGFEYYKNSIGSTEYYGYVEITNTGNKNLYLDNCTFDLEDNDGHLLQSDSFINKCPDIIAPGEKGYFYNSIGENLIDESVSTANGIKLVPQMKIENASGNPVDYEVSDTSLKDGQYGGVKVTGRITNNTNEDDDYLYINIIFYDSAGKVIGITGTSVTELDAGRTVSFDTTTIWGSDSITINSVADYEVIARKGYFQF